jgi:two-component SAPR family response regulator
MEQSEVLYVQMFGNFQMSYGGKILTRERRKDTHFTSLMQILLHRSQTGVSRDYLEDVLFGDRDIENRHQALQTIMYKAKRKLRTMGLPDVNYIVLEDGMYRFTSKIPIEEDAALFERLCRQADGAEDEEEKLNLYRSACYTYKGEFLSSYAGVMWAGAEARRYNEMFCNCVQHTASILRKRQDWFRLEKLGRYVASIAPFSDWESITMEALIKSRRYEEARQLYADTVDSYLKERGIYPSGKIMKMMEELGRQMKHSYEALDQIQKNLVEDTQNIQGGYQCSYPVFRGVYHIVNRMMERGGQSVYIMLCTLVDGKGNPMKEGKRLEVLSERLNEAIRKSVRHGDIINHYGNGQFLVLLINTTREDCVIVERRINQKFIVEGQRTSVQYHINSVICEA